MAIRVLIVLDGEYRFDAGAGGIQDFTYTTLVGALVNAGMQVTKAHRETDSSADVQSFRFDDASVDLFAYDVIWLIGYRGRNVGGGGTHNLATSEIVALMHFMDAGGGVFATGDHDSIGADMCGRIPRVRAARCWYGVGDAQSQMPADFPRNFPPLSIERADTTRQNPLGDYSSQPGPFVWFENQSDSVPQPITPTTSPAHPILRREGRDIVVYPDHMHEGQTLGEVPGYAYDQEVTLDGQTFKEFPALGGERPRPEVIAQGQVWEHTTALAAEGAGADASVSSSKTVNTLSVYDGRRVGVGRIVTGATFHHYVDINLTGTSAVDTPEEKAKAGPDAEKGHGFAHPGAEAVFADIKAVFVNITNWLARPRPAVGLILERSTFGEDEVTVNPQFDGALLVTVDGLKPSQFPNGGITTLSPSPAQLQAWAPVPTIENSALEIVATGMATDEAELLDRLQRFTFTYQVKFVGAAFSFPGASLTVPVSVSLVTAAVGSLTDSALISLVKSANPFMLDLDGGNKTYWLSSDLKVFKVVAGSTLYGVTLPNNATRAQALTFIDTLTNNISVAQFESLSGDPSTSALSVFPTTTESNKNVYNFAIARVRRNGTTAVANDVRVFFRIFTSQTTAALTYQEAMGAPIEGYLKTAGTNPIALPGHASGEWVSFPCFAQQRAATPSAQQDVNNVRTITTAEHNKFFGALLDTNLDGNYLSSTPAGGETKSLRELLAGEHQCLVAQIEFSGTPIPNGANPSTSDKLAQRNIAYSEVANPGLAASRVAMHTFELEATPQFITSETPPDELLLQWAGVVPSNTVVRIYVATWSAEEVIELADRNYPRHEIRFVDARTIELPGGHTRYVPIPRSLRRQTGIISAEFPLGIKKGQRFDVSVRQITNRVHRAKVPPPKVTPISREEADKLLSALPKLSVSGRSKNRGVFDLGNHRSLVTDLSVLDASGDHALVIEHPAPDEVRRAQSESRRWRETIGAFQLGVPVSTKDDMLLHHLRLLSVTTLRVSHLSRTSRWYATLSKYLELLADKVRALGGDPYSVPPTPDGMIPQLPKGEGGQTGQGPTSESPHAPTSDGAFEPKDESWLWESTGLDSDSSKQTLWSGKVSGILYDHFGDFEGFTLERYTGSHVRYFSRETAIHELAKAAWRERCVVTVVTSDATSRHVRRLLLRS